MSNIGNISYKQEAEDYYDLIVLIVNKFLKKHWRYKVYRDDLIGEGALGLMRSISTYKKELGASKVTYYSKGIKNFISNYVRQLNKEVSTKVYIDNISEKHLIQDEEVEENVDYCEIYEKYKPREYVDRLIYERVLTGFSSTTELAEELGVSFGMIQKKKVRLIKRLRELMKEEDI